ncbi:MAG: transporter substrate-binding domain-containing protein [Alphaproteobacteria bacterium]|nr:transporter substrate-binding domain-containing protein [Alphaproteobacteria bacterium]
MKQFLLIVLAVVVGLAIGAKTNLLSSDGTKPKVEQAVSAYERVRDTGVLRCGYVNWKPYYYLEGLESGNKQPTGINYDLMNELGKVAGLKIEWIEEVSSRDASTRRSDWFPAKWTEAVRSDTIGEGFKTGRYDGVCTSMWADAAKVRNLHLSRPIFYSGPHFFARANDKRFDGRFDLINKTDVKIAVIDGAPSYKWVKENVPDAQVVSLPQGVRDAEYVLALITKKVDLIIYDPDEVAGYREVNLEQIHMVEGVPSGWTMPHVMAFADPKLTAMMNVALQILIDNGVMEKLRAKYQTHYFVPVKSLRE